MASGEKVLGIWGWWVKLGSLFLSAQRAAQSIRSQPYALCLLWELEAGKWRLLPGNE